MERTASVKWTGTIREGAGKITTASGALRGIPYSFGTRFGAEPGTNPEELLASAHAGCFTMALAAELEKRGFRPDSLDTEATTSLLQEEGARWTIASVHLSVSGEVPGATAAEFEAAAREAKENCPVSRLFRGATITMDANLSREENPKRGTDAAYGSAPLH